MTEDGARDSIGAAAPARMGRLAGAQRLLAQYHWAPFIVPFVVYMALGSLEPAPDKAVIAPTAQAETPAGPAARTETRPAEPTETPPSSTPSGGAARRTYPWIYTLKVVATLLAVALAWPVYRSFEWRGIGLAALVGLVGIVEWVAVTHAEHALLGELHPAAWMNLGQRVGYNPWAEMASPAAAALFFGVRMIGLGLVVPIVEEFFLRGFLARYLVQPDWWRVAPGTWHLPSLALVTVLAVAMHPQEAIAAALWFTMISWLMLRTRSLWACVVAHSVTNVLLGLYVVASGEWEFL